MTPICDYCGDESRVLLRATIGSSEWPHVCPECARECTRCGAIGVADEDFKASDSRGAVDRAAASRRIRTTKMKAIPAFGPESGRGFIVSASDVAKFLAHVQRDNACWLWQGRKNSGGYGVMSLRGYRGPFVAHRIAMAVHLGRSLPPGLVVMHTCDNPACVRVDHLRLGTQSENIRDAVAKGRMPSRRDRAHCRHGHELTPENTVERRDRRRNFVYRACRTCEREISLKSWRKRHPPLDRENCRRGHALTPENTVYRRNRRGCLHRRCRTCERENARESYRRCHSHSVSTQL